MVNDMYQNQKAPTNPYEYSLKDFKHIDESQFCYQEAEVFVPDIKKLVAIAIDQDDQLYLTGSGKVQIYNKNLELVNQFDLTKPARSIAVSTDGKIYLGISDHVEIWSQQGKLLGSWEAFAPKSIITSIAIDEESIYVADAGKKLVLKYDKDGKLLAELGAKDKLTKRLGFLIPSGYFDVAIGREGQLWAVNPGMHAFEAYDESGEMISSWHKTSMDLDGFSGCCNPSHFAMLSNGDFITSEKGLVRVKVIGPDGNVKCAVAGPEDFDEKEVGIDLAVNSNDDIFMIVPGKNEVRKFVSFD